MTSRRLSFLLCMNVCSALTEFFAGCTAGNPIETEDTGETENGDSGGYEETDSQYDDWGNGPTIYNLKIEDNPNSVLSCFVTWQTDAASTSTVLFGEHGYTFRIRDDRPATEHQVLVIGMHAETAYQFKVLSASSDPAGQSSVETSYTTDALPDIIPVVTPGPDHAEFTNESWTLVNVSDNGASPPPPAAVIMYDDFGQPVWYYIDGENPDDRGDIDARLLDNEVVLIGATAHEPAREVDLAGNVIWEGPIQEGFEVMHHHFDKLEDGNYVTLRHVHMNDISGDYMEVFTPDLEVLWQWNIFDYVTPASDATGDWTHANSVTLDFKNNVFYFNCRNISALFKVNMSGEQNIIWTLSADGDFLSDPSAQEPWFAHQHDPEIQENGNILIYDNGDNARGHSRVVEYALNEETMQSEIVFEFPGDFDVDSWYRESWYTHLFGDADRLENGNIQVASGDRTSESRIFEISMDGEVVRELKFPQGTNGSIAIYRAQRIPVPPHVELL